MNTAVCWLRDSLQYEFRDEALLARALTHRSVAGLNNERLEFLGDAVLDLVVSEAVWHMRPDASEGTLSRMRSSLVKDTTLVELAGELGLVPHLIVGAGVRKAGGYARSSILADALEAIFGAVYLDAGFAEARRVVRAAYGRRLLELPDSASLRDPKTRLQEHLQARKLDLPSYQVEKTTGEAHRQSFEVSCRIDALDAMTIGRGTSRRRAEQDAARKMLALVGEAG